MKIYLVVNISRIVISEAGRGTEKNLISSSRDR